VYPAALRSSLAFVRLPGIAIRIVSLLA